MLYQRSRLAHASRPSLMYHRPKMPELGIEPRLLSRTHNVLGLLASESAVAQLCLYSCRYVFKCSMLPLLYVLTVYFCPVYIFLVESLLTSHCQSSKFIEQQNLQLNFRWRGSKDSVAYLQRKSSQRAVYLLTSASSTETLRVQ